MQIRVIKHDNLSLPEQLIIAIKKDLLPAKHVRRRGGMYIPSKISNKNKIRTDWTTPGPKL
jgi:hypothetical protein